MKEMVQRILIMIYIYKEDEYFLIILKYFFLYKFYESTHHQYIKYPKRTATPRT